MNGVIRKLLAAGALSVVAVGPAAVADDAPHSLGPGIFVRPLRPGIWLHVARRPHADGGTANGLLVTTGSMSLLVDVGWTAEQTSALLDWADEGLGQPVEHVILTHAHADRAGGLAALEGREAILHGHAGTAIRLQESMGIELDWTFEFQDRLDIGGERIELLYPGPGHALDNIVVYLPRRRVLFAGCLVRSEHDGGLGDLADANLAAWPFAVRRVIERFRDVDVLIPGHGSVGGVELLSHTMELLEAAGYSAFDDPRPTTR